MENKEKSNWTEATEDTLMPEERQKLVQEKTNQLREEIEARNEREKEENDKVEHKKAA